MVSLFLTFNLSCTSVSCNNKDTILILGCIYIYIYSQCILADFSIRTCYKVCYDVQRIRLPDLYVNPHYLLLSLLNDTKITKLLLSNNDKSKRFHYRNNISILIMMVPGPSDAILLWWGPKRNALKHKIIAVFIISLSEKEMVTKRINHP